MGKRWNRRRAGRQWGVSASAGAAQGITSSAGSDVQTTSNSNQALAGSVSNGSAASWAWVLQTKPSSSSASISSATSQNATLTGIDKRGAYICKLTVTDGNSFTDTAMKTVDFAMLAPPTSEAGSDVQTASSSNQTLSGSGSGGVGSLSYQWTLTTRPAASSASISSATSATATLTGIDNSGAYHCTLVVTDSAGTPQTGRDSVVIEYTGANVPAWRTVMDLNFKTMTVGALTENGTGTSTVDGVQYYARVRNTGDMSFTMTDGTGLVCDFGSSTTGENRISFLVGNRLTTSPEGHYPRIRIAAHFEGLVMPTAGDYLGVGMNVMWRNHNDGYMPRVICKYRRYGGDYNWYAQCEKGSWGNAASGSETSGIVDADEVDNGVMSCLDAGGGVWQARGHTGDATIAVPGSEPFKAMVTITGFNDFTTDKHIYRSDGGARGFDGPYACLTMRNAGNNSQAVTWTRLVVEEYS